MAKKYYFRFRHYEARSWQVFFCVEDLSDVQVHSLLEDLRGEGGSTYAVEADSEEDLRQDEMRLSRMQKSWDDLTVRLSEPHEPATAQTEFHLRATELAEKIRASAASFREHWPEPKHLGELADGLYKLHHVTAHCLEGVRQFVEGGVLDLTNDPERAIYSAVLGYKKTQRELAIYAGARII